jgi:hypothetical protein
MQCSPQHFSRVDVPFFNLVAWSNKGKKIWKKMLFMEKGVFSLKSAVFDPFSAACMPMVLICNRVPQGWAARPRKTPCGEHCWQNRNWSSATLVVITLKVTQGGTTELNSQSTESLSMLCHDVIRPFNFLNLGTPCHFPEVYFGLFSAVRTGFFAIWYYRPKSGHSAFWTWKC